MPDEDMLMNPPEEAPAVDEAPATPPEGQIVLTEEAVALIVKLVKDALAAGADAGEIEKADGEDEPDGDEPADDDEIQKAIRKLDARYKKELETIQKAHKAEIAKLTADIDTIRKAKVQKVAVMDLEEARKANHQPGNAAIIGALLGGR
jgi:hypothetical protein